ncbi:MAG: DUF192 domain-containing protein [Patescibacteria group bacterium]
MRLSDVATNPFAVTAGIVMAAIILTLGVMTIGRPPQFSDDATVTVRIDQAKLRADVAVSREKLAKGLMGAEPLPDDQGMLFVYEEPSTPRIWMKGVSFPIDIVWISGDTVTQVTPGVPPPKPGAADADLPRYSPDGPVDKVLEVDAGWARRHSVQSGDPVRITR